MLQTTHISSLPMKIVLYILQWVVSSELDIQSLETISRVCKGFFYVCARDAEIWRLAYIHAWGVNCGHFEPKYQSWRDMYLQRPRLRYNGCYISKTTYIRPGENSVQDQFYKLWHLVEYYNRYLRYDNCSFNPSIEKLLFPPNRFYQTFLIVIYIVQLIT